MRRLLLAVVCLLSAAGAASAGESPRVWVLAVGVNRYTRPAYHALPYAADAARQIAGLLRDLRPDATNVCVMTCTTDDAMLIPNRPNLLEKLKEIQPGESDLVIFYFCGHGVEIPGAAGQPAEQYLLLRDVTDLGDPEAREAGAMRLSWLRRRLESIPCGTRILMLDACRETPESLGASAGDGGSQAITDAFQSVGSGWSTSASVTFFACRPGEKAYASKRGQSYFAEALMEGLSGRAADGRGEITLASLARYVTSRVPEIVGGDQRPEIRQTPCVLPDLPAAVPLRPALPAIACPSFAGEFGRVFAGVVYTRLAASREVSLVDRKRLDAAIDELRLQNSGLVEAKSAQQIGKVVGAPYVLVGGSERAPGNRLQVGAYVIEAATGRQVPGVAAECTVDPEDPDTYKPMLQSLAEDLLGRLRSARLTTGAPTSLAGNGRPQTAGPPPLGTGALRVESDPPGAQVFVGGDDRARGVTPLTVDGLPAGPVVILVRPTRDDLGNVTRTVAITPGQPVSLKVEFPLLQGALRVRSEPVGATVTVDGEPRGVTTADGLTVIGLRLGPHAVSLSLARHRAWEGSGIVRFNSVTEVSRTLTPLPGTLIVDSTPPGAKVFLDGEGDLRGTTTAILREVPAGRHTVRVFLRGYAACTEDVTLGAGEQKAVTFTLKALQRAQLEVTSTPPGASILVDGKERGKAPLTLDMDEVGETPQDVRVEASLAGYTAKSESVRLALGDQKTLAFTLVKDGEPAAVTPAGSVLDGDLEEIIMDTGITPVEGVWGAWPHDTVVSAGKSFHGCGWTSWGGSGSALIDVHGYDHFSTSVGVLDIGQGDATFAIELDGVQVFRKRVKSGETPQDVRVPLTGHKRLRLIRDQHSGDTAVFLEPRLYRKRRAPTPPATHAAGAEFTDSLMDDSVHPLEGVWGFAQDTVVCGGKEFRGIAWTSWGGSGSALFDIGGYDCFRCWVGAFDGTGSEATFTIEVDDVEVFRGRAKSGDMPREAHISLRGHKQMRLIRDQHAGDRSVFLDPRLHKQK